jgi:hypothetical protein
MLPVSLMDLRTTTENGLTSFPINKTSIRNMEVHQHAHHEGKKNLKSYFREFLILFLAVTPGFRVGNQREHYIERLRAKEFSKTLVKDLQNDTAAIHTQKKSAEPVPQELKNTPGKFLRARD